MNRTIAKCKQNLTAALVLTGTLLMPEAMAKFISPDHPVRKPAQQQLPGKDIPGNGSKRQMMTANFDGGSGLIGASNRNLNQLAQTTGQTLLSNDKTRVEKTEQGVAISGSEVSASGGKQPEKKLAKKTSGIADPASLAKTQNSGLKTIKVDKTSSPSNDKLKSFNPTPAAIDPAKVKQIEKKTGKQYRRALPVGEKRFLQQKAEQYQQKQELGLIDEQINDVLDTDEFIQLQRSEVFLPSQKQQASSKDTENGSESEPEATLLLLDQSDLMDYVAEDDFWQEQLTIEDEPG
jgi:hypothetical protein